MFVQIPLSKLGWGRTIIAPVAYQANYCAGACTFPLSKVSHCHHHRRHHRRRRRRRRLCRHHQHHPHESGNG